MNAFDCAIKMEAEATLYYQKLAADVADHELKNLFTMLAQAEQEHHDALMQMKESTDIQKPQFSALEQASCLFKPLLAKRELLAKLKGDPDAYQMVISQEEEAVKLYQDMAEQTKDEGDRAMLLKIADEERKHLSIVENIYAFVESPKTFLASGEFSNLKEY